MFFIEAKWWRLEIKFERPLKKKEVRILKELVKEDDGCFGKDGAIFEQFPEKFPGQYAENKILKVLSKIKAESFIRLAPFGRDCPGTICECCSEDREECELGNAISCEPILKESDWKKVSFV